MTLRLPRLSLGALTLALIPACSTDQKPVTQNAPASQQAKAEASSAGPDKPEQTEPSEQTVPAEVTKAADQPQGPAGVPQDDSDPRLTWPRDGGKVVARVAGRDITLKQVLRHVDRHFENYTDFLSTKVGHLELRSTKIPDFIRQYADFKALDTEARSRAIPRPKILAAQKAAYDDSFRRYCENYRQRMRKAPPPPGPSRRSFVLQFQKLNGLHIEIDGLMRAMIPAEITQLEADRFYRDYQRNFNGVIDVAQIFIRNRDEKTGALYEGEKRKKIEERIRKIESLLEKDGSNFADIAARFSHSERSRALGGLLKNLKRMDPRMPSSICRAAWFLREGEWTGPVESRFGLHFIRRGPYTAISMVLHFDAKNRDVQNFILAHKKEDLLFSLRKKYDLELRY